VHVLGCYPHDGVMLEKNSPTCNSPFSKLVTSARSTALKIAIIGFGTFGQFLAARWVQRGHVVIAYSRSDYSKEAAALGAECVSDIAELVKLEPDVVVIAVSILSFEAVLGRLPMGLFQRALVVDVLSVKSHAKQVMLRVLPRDADVICTHPMFGPESGKDGWHDLPCVYEKVRVTDHHRACRFIALFEDEGCRMVKMSCEQHDQLAAGSQFVTHLTGRLLSKLSLKPSPIATKGFQALLQLQENTCKDSFDLFYALYSHNVNSSEQLEQFASALDKLQRDLVNFRPGTGASNRDELPADISRLVRSMDASQTVAISDLAIELKRQGLPILSLSVGEPDFAPHPEVLAAAHKALNEGQTKYTANAGLHQLRAQICADLHKRKGVAYTPEQVVCSNGGKQGIVQAMLALLNPGDEVIIPAPYWTSYLSIVQLCRATPVFLRMTAEENYCAQPAALEELISPNTRMFILCNPSNPTGSVHPLGLLERLAEVLRRHPHVFIMADEIYECITFDIQHVCFAGLNGMYERTILINGFSKGSAMTGFRLGYMAAPLHIAKAAAKVQGNNTSCPCSISQWAGVAALQNVDEAFLQQQVCNLRMKRDFIIPRLNAIEGVTCPIPQGAFYAFPTISAMFGRYTPSGICIKDSLGLCEYLMRDCHVALVPGDAFGAPNELRISYATSMDIISEAVQRIERGLAALRKNP